MNGITLLIIIVFVGYFYNNKYPQSNKNLIYFGIGCTIFLTFLYFMNYQQGFVYKMAKNVKDIQNQPLHTSIPDFNPTINSHNVKYQIANKQGLRCPNCRNPIMLEDIKSYKMSYIVPIDQGGTNDTNNLKLICPTCYQFRSS